MNKQTNNNIKQQQQNTSIYTDNFKTDMNVILTLAKSLF